MTFLPIIGRELRVASRRRLTYWGRFSAAALAMALFALMLIIARASQGMLFKTGDQQFMVMKWFCFLFACFTGMFLTADCLSEEKREGTLGLLFLTDLHGYDIVLGKLFSQSAQTLYGLLAVVPILGLTLMLGGVSGTEFWRVALVIGNTVFLMLAIGLMVSSISRDGLKAMNLTLLVSLALLGGLPLGDLWIAGWDANVFEPLLSHASPAFVFATAGPRPPNLYWFEIGLQHALAWVFLGVASYCSRRAWQDKSSPQTRRRPTLASRARFGGTRSRLAFRRRLFGKNPILWLVSRDRWLPRLIWAVSLAGLAVVGYASRPRHGDFGPSESMECVSWVLYLAFFLWMASQSTRFLGEARRSGALELILVTPVEPRQIVKSQRQALCRTFLIPVLILIGLSVALKVIEIQNTIKSDREYRQQPAPTGPAAQVAADRAEQARQFARQVHGEIVNQVIFLATLLTNLAAVASYGIWAGLSSRKPSVAVLKTLGFVLIIPWLVMGFLLILLEIASTTIKMLQPLNSTEWPMWIVPLCLAVGNVAKDVCFILWARKRLRTQFRELAGQFDGAIVKKAKRIRPPRSAPPPIPGGSIQGGAK